MILIPLLQFDFQHNQWSYHTSNKKALITFFFSRNAILIIIRRVFVIACLFCSVDFRCGSSRSGSKIRLWFCFFFCFSSVGLFNKRFHRTGVFRSKSEKWNSAHLNWSTDKHSTKEKYQYELFVEFDVECWLIVINVSPIYIHINNFQCVWC